MRIWDVSTTNISLLLKFSTNEIFETSSVRAEESAIGPNYDDEGEDEWPPFRKVGGVNQRLTNDVLVKHVEPKPCY